ncbi:MAG: glycosyltransferase [Candidatus Omnitrophota bacterium]
MSIPLVSIIIPSFNRAKLLQRAIQSVLRQTYQNFEVIVVDDASTDHTREVVLGFSDPRLRYIRNEKNLKGPRSRNIGIKQARGEYISLLDDDDEFLPEKIEKEVNKFRDAPEEVGVVYCGHSFVVNNKIAKIMLPQYRGDVSEITWRHPVLSLPAALIKKKCFEKSGLFDETFVSCQDWDLWIRVAQHCRFDYINESLLNVYMHGGEISTNIQNRVFGIERILDKYAYEYQKRKKTHSLLLKRLGFLYLLKGDRPKGSQRFKESFCRDPLALRNYVMFVLLLISGRSQKIAIGKYAKLIHQIGDITYF